jgi:hypothetical protein
LELVWLHKIDEKSFEIIGPWKTLTINSKDKEKNPNSPNNANKWYTSIKSQVHELLVKDDPKVSQGRFLSENFFLYSSSFSFFFFSVFCRTSSANFFKTQQKISQNEKEDIPTRKVAKFTKGNGILEGYALMVFFFVIFTFFVRCTEKEFVNFWEQFTKVTSN